MAFLGLSSSLESDWTHKEAAGMFIGAALEGAGMAGREPASHPSKAPFSIKKDS